ncbi:MAG TPA: lipopolysaccharide biosynthesis protein [Terriglobales bacterium]|nr:lipopolysaccharide biosynthesis protein [Terriglobales bacterium]
MKPAQLNGESGCGGTDTGILALPISIFRRVWRDASWSLAGNLLTVASGLATLKIIGKLVPTADYGAATLVLGVCALLNQFIAGPLLSERIRLYFDHLKQGHTRTLSGALGGLLVKTSGLIAIVYVVGAGIFYLRGQATYLQLLLPVLVLIFMQPQLAAAFAQLEAHRNYRGLSLAQPLLNALQVPLLLILLWLAVSGAASIVWAQALAAVLVFGGLALKSGRTASASVGTEGTLSQSAISSFGWSLYLFNLASWIMSTSDRYLIDHFLQRSDVGIYVINYAFWAIPYTVLNGWINSFARPRLYARAADHSWGRVLRVVMATLGAGAGLAVVGTGIIYLLGKPLALWILGEKYWHSEQLMMLLATAHIFFLVGHTTSAYFLAIKNSHWVWISSLVAAMASIAANIVLLPKLGIIAAAITTLGGYAFWALLMLGGMLLWSRRMADPANQSVGATS